MAFVYSKKCENPSIRIIIKKKYLKRTKEHKNKQLFWKYSKFSIWFKRKKIYSAHKNKKEMPEQSSTKQHKTMQDE